MNFPFETIAAAMRFIDDAMVPVIVAKEEATPGEVGALTTPCALQTASAGSRESLVVTRLGCRARHGTR